MAVVTQQRQQYPNNRMDQRRRARAGYQHNHNSSMGQQQHGNNQGQGHMFNKQQMMPSFSEACFNSGINPFHSSPFHPLSSTITVTIQGLPMAATLKEIRERFSKYGKTVRVWSPEDTDIGMVTYRNSLEAEAAIRGEYNALMHREEIKVSPSIYSAAPVSSVKPDLKYWRCSLCHNTNRSSSESCGAYRCGFGKTESDDEWAEINETKPTDPMTARWAIAKLFKDLPPVVHSPRSVYKAPHCLAVLNLTQPINETQLRRVFLRYGQITYVKLLHPPVDGETAIEAQVVFEDSESLEQAAEHENGKQISPHSRVRAHRVTSPFIVAITPPYASPFTFQDEDEVKEMKDSLFASFTEFGVVRDVSVAPEECLVEVLSLRSVIQAIMQLHNRTFKDKVVAVHLSNSTKTKWPCFDCCNINPPGSEKCLDCGEARPDFANLQPRNGARGNYANAQLPKLWTDAVRKRIQKTKADDASKGSSRGPASAPRARHQRQRDAPANTGYDWQNEKPHRQEPRPPTEPAALEIPGEEHGNVLDMLSKATGVPVGNRGKLHPAKPPNKIAGGDIDAHNHNHNHNHHTHYHAHNSTNPNPNTNHGHAPKHNHNHHGHHNHHSHNQNNHHLSHQQQQQPQNNHQGNQNQPMNQPQGQNYQNHHFNTQNQYQGGKGNFQQRQNYGRYNNHGHGHNHHHNSNHTNNNNNHNNNNNMHKPPHLQQQQQHNQMH